MRKQPEVGLGERIFIAATYLVAVIALTLSVFYPDRETRVVLAGIIFGMLVLYLTYTAHRWIHAWRSRRKE